MKIIKKEIVTTVEKYIAEDGTEFTSEKACLDYEEDCLIESAKNKIFKNCEICKALKDCCPCDGGEYMEDHNFTWVRPNSEEDIDALEKAFGPHFKTEDIGKWLCIEGTPYDSDTWVERLEESIKYIDNLFSALGYAVDIKPAEEKVKENKVE